MRGWMAVRRRLKGQDKWSWLIVAVMGTVVGVAVISSLGDEEPKLPELVQDMCLALNGADDSYARRVRVLVKLYAGEQDIRPGQFDRAVYEACPNTWGLYFAVPVPVGGPG